jgi:hypothetical protein
LFTRSRRLGDNANTVQVEEMRRDGEVASIVQVEKWKKGWSDESAGKVRSKFERMLEYLYSLPHAHVAVSIISAPFPISWPCLSVEVDQFVYRPSRPPGLRPMPHRAQTGIVINMIRSCFRAQLYSWQAVNLQGMSSGLIKTGHGVES